MSASLARRLTAELAGTAMLTAVVTGSAIMGSQLAPGQPAMALLANTLATAAGLLVLIRMFGPVSGAHFNPVVSLCMRLDGVLSNRDMLAYMLMQCAGGVAGIMLAHAMFDLPLLSLSGHARHGSGVLTGELVASFGLIGCILCTSRFSPHTIPVSVAAWIGAGYWFTSSTGFANPAVTLARAFTGSDAGIRLGDVAGFSIAQVTGAVLAWILFRWLLPQSTSAQTSTSSDDHQQTEPGVNTNGHRHQAKA